MELNVSPELAKIFGTKKEEKISRPQVKETFNYLSHKMKLSSAVCQETLGLLEGEQAPGPPEQAVVHPWRNHGSHLRRGEDQGLLDDEVPEGASHQPGEVICPHVFRKIGSNWLLFQLLIFHFVKCKMYLNTSDSSDTNGILLVWMLPHTESKREGAGNHEWFWVTCWIVQTWQMFHKMSEQ